MSTILDGKIAREHYTGLLKEKISKLSFIPQLIIIQVGSRADSDSFIRSKKAFAQKIGVKEQHIQLDEKVTQEDVINLIEKYNNDKETQGIIVQLPLPSHVDSDKIINTINPQKDIDGLTPHTKFTPATARGISELFDFYKIELKNKKITVLGRSKLVGTPIAIMCREKGALVTVCSKETKDIQVKTKSADIIIVAIGQPKHINETYISHDQIIIDVGITREGDRLVGDVDFDKVKSLVTMITPVPGGVGQMTVLALFENLIDACYNANITN